MPFLAFEQSPINASLAYAEFVFPSGHAERSVRDNEESRRKAD